MIITRLLYSKWLKVQETWGVFTGELRRIFSDPGVVVIFFVATLAYPILYNFIYWKDNVENVPVAVVDMSHSQESRAFLHKWKTIVTGAEDPWHNLFSVRLCRVP